MQRVPTHEPWPQHESVAPASFTLERTDSNITAITITNTSTGRTSVVGDAPSASVPFPAKNGIGGDRGTVHFQPFPWSTDQPFLTKVKEVSARLNFDPLDLIGIMYLESNTTFDPSVDNGAGKNLPGSEGMGYVGLIQFGTEAVASFNQKAKAKKLPPVISKKQLIAMGRVEQMNWVEKYFNAWGWPNASVGRANIAQIYMTVFLPKFRFSGLDEIVAKKNDPESGGWYSGNPGFDSGNPKKGYITPRMVQDAALVRKRAALQVLANNGTSEDLVVTKK
jgi:hypothetical protein